MDFVPSLIGIIWEAITRRHRIEVQHGVAQLPTGMPAVFVCARNAGRSAVWVDTAAIVYENGAAVQIPMSPTRLEPDGPWSTFPAAGLPAAGLDLTASSTGWVREPGGRRHHD